jgi:formylglycine-generating enzyme required for sulfatase activity
MEESGRKYDVFLSYSTKDKNWADAACAVLERHHVRCWIAPRDIIPGDEWGASIIRGINASRIMVLIFSGHANGSGQVRREVERAISQGMILLPVRIEEIRPDGAMEYALGNTHWLDAFAPPIERQLDLLARSVKTLLGHDVALPAAPAPAKSAAVAPAKLPHSSQIAPTQSTHWKKWLIALTGCLFGLIALAVIIINIQGRVGREPKIAASDDASLTVEAGPATVEHSPKVDSVSSTTPGKTPEARPTDESRRLLTNKPAADISNSIGMKLRLIPAGEFMMGSPEGDDDAAKAEKPRHRVRITRPFYLGLYEVTQAEYKAVTGINPSFHSANGGGKDKVEGHATDSHPVENVTWLEAVRFCNKLSEKEGRHPFYRIDGASVDVPDWNGPGYRLPTEAEWEYACRANVSIATRYSFGDEASLGEFAWFRVNSKNRTHIVGEKPPNGFGLHDMHGNVYEWCWDWAGEDYYKGSPVDDPRGPDRYESNSHRVRRGGNVGSPADDCRSAARDWVPPHERWGGMGFRLALGQSGG